MRTGNYVGNRIRKCCKSGSNSMALRLNISACAKFSNTPLPNLFIIDYIGAGLPVCLTNGRCIWGKPLICVVTAFDTFC